MRVPGRVVLAVLGGDARGRAVRAAEHDRGAHLAAGHVERLGRRIDDLVDRLHGEVEGHEFDDRLQAGERRADAETGKAMLGDRRVDHALRAEFLQQPLRDLVGALIFGDLLAHHEHVVVAAHLLGHGVAQRFAHGLRHHLGAFRHVGLGLVLRLRRRGDRGDRRVLVLGLLGIGRVGRLRFLRIPRSLPGRPWRRGAARRLDRRRRPRRRPGSPRSAC